MSSCSKELTAKTSKPKMSNKPMDAPFALPFFGASPDASRATLQRSTRSSKSALYNALSSASRARAAASWLSRRSKYSPSAKTLRDVSAVSRCPTSTPKAAPTAARRPPVAGDAREPASSVACRVASNWTAPRCSTAASVSKTDVDSDPTTPKALSASRRSSSDSTSRTPSWRPSTPHVDPLTQTESPPSASPSAGDPSGQVAHQGCAPPSR